MQKQVNFFEQNVQWFALGLGGLFLVWMIFSYILSQPVKVELVGQPEPLGPGEVDPATLRGPVEALKRDIDKRELPKIVVVDYVESFVAAIKGGSEQLPTLAATGINYTPPQGAIVGPDGAVATAQDGAPQEVPIKELPKLPPARFVVSSSGRSSVTFPDPAWVPDERRPHLQQPMLEADKDWVTLSFTVNGEVLAKAFKAAFDEKKLDAAYVDPLLFMQTALIDVELVRQQILPGGKVGKEEVVKRLQNSLLPPYPGNDAGEFQVFEYLSLVSTNPNEVMFPPFYEVIAGDPWMMPSEENERFAAQDRAARLAQRKAEREQQRVLNQQRRQMQQQIRRGPAGMAPGWEEGMMFEDEMEGDFGMMPPGIPGRPFPQRPLAPGARQPAPGQGQLQGGKFDVETFGDLMFIAHDDTLEPGKTYRYKVRYRLLNPAYKGVRIAVPEVVKEVDIDSPWSGWSAPIAVRPKVEFFLARLAGAGEPKGEFDVFEWKDGRMIKQTVSAAPGDAIGKTGWSMVDVRGTGRRSYGLIVDETGLMHRREPEDPSNPSDRYLFLLDEVEAANPQVGLNR